jgi:MGT family glycosyltransferase
MKKILYFSLPGHGHTNPTLVLSKELQKRGNTVLYYSTETFKKRIDDAGLTYRSYSPHEYDSNNIGNVAIFAKKLIERTEFEVEYLLPVLQKEKPDLIVHDSFAVWGKMLSQLLGIPAVSVFTTMALNFPIAFSHPAIGFPMIGQLFSNGKNTMRTYLRYKKLASSYDLPTDSFSQFIFSKERLNIVLTSSFFHPLTQTLGNNFEFVGPLLPTETGELYKEFDPQKKLVYLSMGTMFNKNLALFHQFVNAFSGTDYQVLVSLGGGLDSIGDVPKNVIVKKFVPQLRVLQHTDVFISHGGMNSVSESLSAGVPLLLLPQMFEQQVNASRVAALGAGIYYKKKKITKDDLLRSVEALLHEKKYKDNALKIKATFQEAGGVKRAADLIEMYH